MKPHFMVSECDGGLYDTRLPGWAEKPLRPAFSCHFLAIESPAQFKASLRAGGFAWPGGYRLAFYCSDEGVLCYTCARAEARNVIYSLRHDIRDGWHVAGVVDVDNSDSHFTCDHCGETLNETESE